MYKVNTYTNTVAHTHIFLRTDSFYRAHNDPLSPTNKVRLSGDKFAMHAHSAPEKRDVLWPNASVPLRFDAHDGTHCACV